MPFWITKPIHPPILGLPGCEHGDPARFRVRGPGAPVLEGIESGHRALLLPPLADGAGYSLVLKQDEGNDKILHERKSALELEPAVLADVGGQL
ncbi:MAG: hypothetical protein HY744_33740 [Deltaproteobacteria bacterium]|nr:hypothetical protein [Deltaproteobacteria bacterium]